MGHKWRTPSKRESNLHLIYVFQTFRYDSERTVYEHTNHVPFYIVPQGLTTRGLFTTNLSNSPCRKVEVIDWSNASILDLDVTKDTFEAAQSGFSDNLMGWMVGDRPKGIQTCEKMLLNGTTLTAIGEIVISKDTGDIKVQSPSTGENYYLIKVGFNMLDLRYLHVILTLLKSIFDT